MRFEAIRRLWERLQSSEDRSLPQDTDSYTDSELAFGKLVLPVLEDLDTMKRLLDEMANRARALQVVLDRLPVAAVVLDDEGRLLTISRAGRELFGGPALPATVLTAARRAVAEGSEHEASLISNPARRGATLRVIPAEVEDDAAEGRGGDRAGVVFLVPADEPPELNAGSLRDRFGLTRSEANIVCRVAQGASNKEIGEELDLSVETVRSHLTSAYRKTGARNRASLVALAYGAPFGQAPIASQREVEHG